jgi:aliphatic nitrilase
MKLIEKRKRMMDSVGHYARPELLSLNLNQIVQQPLHASPATYPAPQAHESTVSAL